jgi:hypothetical protein
MSLSLKDHASDAGVSKWIAEVGCTDALIPRRNIKLALEFFDAHMPGLSIADAVSFIAAMDLSKPVNRVYLAPGERVIGFRTLAESPFKLFFARRGSSPHKSGINTAGRGPVAFTVRTTVQALESFTTGTVDTWTPRQPGQSVTVAPRAQKWFGKEFGVMAMAGGAQLIIPQSYSHLLVEER